MREQSKDVNLDRNGKQRMRGQARKARGNSVGDQDKCRCRRIEVVCGQVEAESKQTTRLQARDSLRHINITWGMSESVGVKYLILKA